MQERKKLTRVLDGGLQSERIWVFFRGSGWCQGDGSNTYEVVDKFCLSPLDSYTRVAEVMTADARIEISIPVNNYPISICNLIVINYVYFFFLFSTPHLPIR